MTDWCILLTAPSSTLGLAASLARDGYDVWTPVETVTLRARRSHPQSEAPAALMPSFVFARMHHLDDLLDLSHNPALTFRRWNSSSRRMVTHGHPYFQVMPSLDVFGDFASVPEWHLAPLRAIEYRRRPKDEVRQWRNGDRVRLTEGSYAGLYGSVTDCEGVFPAVLIDGWRFPVRVSVWLLHRDLDDTSLGGVSDEQSKQAPIAKAA